MDRRTLLEHLAKATEHVRKGSELLARERTIIQERRRDGHDISDAERLLETMEQSQQMQIEHLENIRKELDELG